MSSDPSASAAFDAALEKLFSGEPLDLEGFLAAHPELTEEERHQLRVLAGSPDEAPRVASATSQVNGGDRLGEFHLIEPLGEGGMGVVWLAAQPSLKRRVAVKVLHATLATTREARERLLREAEALGRVQHPNVVTAISAGEANGTVFVAMEYVPGRGLDELLRDGIGSRPNPMDAVRIALDIARGLAAAHAAGVIHRDIKPSNIRITPQGRAVLTDFGLARGDLGETLTLTGVFRGTPHYASPEQVEARGALDARTDIWSLGATLYEMLAGRPPFPGGTSEQVLNAILTTDPVPLRQLVPSLPRDVEVVVAKSLERDPEARFASAAELVADLEALIDLRPIRARPPALRVRMTRAIRRRPRTAAVAAALSLTLATYLVVEAWRVIADGRRFEAEIASAVAALDREDPETAAACAGRALALRGTDPRVLALRERTTRALALRDAAELVADALSRLDRFRKLQRHTIEVEAELSKLKTIATLSHLDPKEEQRLQRLDAEIPRLIQEIDELTFGIPETITEALKRAPDVPGAADVVCGLHAERLHEAERLGDTRAADAIREALRRADRDGRFTAELLGGVLEIRAQPSDAEIHLLRYREASSVSADAPRRLVPVPLEGRWSDLEPGAPCLQVIRTTSADLLPGDVLVAVEGVTLTSTAELPALAGKRARLLRDGILVDRVLDGESELRVTVAPVLTSPQTRVGSGSGFHRELEVGSYLAVVRHDGFELQRLPVRVERGSTVKLDVTLRPPGFSPKGFVHVPAGPARVGGTPTEVRFFDACESRVATLPEFWIQDHEINWAEYAEFLNAIGPQSARAFAPRSALPGDAPDAELTPPGPGKPWQVADTEAVLPARGLTFAALEAYAAWRTDVDSKAGRPWRYRIPREIEWEKAARGADGRLYPFGSFLSQSWVSSRYALARSTYSRSMSFPVDESPFGAFDMAGSLSEWVIPDVVNHDLGTAALKGGAAVNNNPENFYTVTRLRMSPRSAMWRFGGRLVAERTDAAPDSRR